MSVGKNIIDFNERKISLEETTNCPEENTCITIHADWVKNYLMDRIDFYQNRLEVLNNAMDYATDFIKKHGFHPENFTVLPDSVNEFIHSSWTEFGENIMKKGICFSFDNGSEIYIVETIQIKSLERKEEYAIGCRFLCRSAEELYQFDEQEKRWVPAKELIDR